MTDTKHTPTPWKVEEWYEDTQITGGDGNIICIDTEYYPVAPSEEDMAHIVKCVNMHDELVSNVIELMSEFDTICANNFSSSGEGTPSYDRLVETLKKAGAL